MVVVYVLDCSVSAFRSAFRGVILFNCVCVVCICCCLCLNCVFLVCDVVDVLFVLLCLILSNCLV